MTRSFERPDLGADLVAEFGQRIGEAAAQPDQFGVHTVRRPLTITEASAWAVSWTAQAGPGSPSASASPSELASRKAADRLRHGAAWRGRTRSPAGSRPVRIGRGSARIDNGVPDFGHRAVVTAEEPAPEDQAPADSGADPYVQQVAARGLPGFADGGQVTVVGEPDDRAGQLAGEIATQVHSPPARSGRPVDDPAGLIQQGRYRDSDRDSATAPGEQVVQYTAYGGQPGGRVVTVRPAQRFLVPESVRPGEQEGNLGAAEIDSQKFHRTP